MLVINSDTRALNHSDFRDHQSMIPVTWFDLQNCAFKTTTSRLKCNYKVIYSVDGVSLYLSALHGGLMKSTSIPVDIEAIQPASKFKNHRSLMISNSCAGRWAANSISSLRNSIIIHFEIITVTNRRTFRIVTLRLTSISVPKGNQQVPVLLQNCFLTQDEVNRPPPNTKNDTFLMGQVMST